MVFIKQMLFLSLGIREYKSGYIRIHYYLTALLSNEGQVRTEGGAKFVRERRKMKALTATINTNVHTPCMLEEDKKSLV